MPLLSRDPRTAPLFPRSGCSDVRDSGPVLQGIGSSATVSALAAVRLDGKRAVLVVTDDRALVLATHLLAATRPVRLNEPVGQVRLAITPDPQPGSATVVLSSRSSTLILADAPTTAIPDLHAVRWAETELAENADPPVASTPDPPQGYVPTPPGRPEPMSQSSVPLRKAWEVAEEQAATHLRSCGWVDARLTQPGRDGGADVVAPGLVAQVNSWSEPVGEPPLRDLFGTATARQAVPVFYSTSGFTPAALSWANETNMVLFHLRPNGDASPASAAAHAFHRNRVVGAVAAVRSDAGLFERMKAASERAAQENAARRAVRYRQELDQLRDRVSRTTMAVEKRTQSARPPVRQRARDDLITLRALSQRLNYCETLPPGDRYREDIYAQVRQHLRGIKVWL